MKISLIFVAFLENTNFNIYFFQLPSSGLTTSYESVDTKERISGLEKTTKNILLYQSIAIGAGIRIGDLGQLNILVPFVATLLCILHDVARD